MSAETSAAVHSKAESETHTRVEAYRGGLNLNVSCLYASPLTIHKAEWFRFVTHQDIEVGQLQRQHELVVAFRSLHSFVIAAVC